MFANVAIFSGMAGMAISGLLLIVGCSGKVSQKYPIIQKSSGATFLLFSSFTAIFWDLWFGISVILLAVTFISWTFTNFEKYTKTLKATCIVSFLCYLAYTIGAADVIPNQPAFRGLLVCSGALLSCWGMAHLVEYGSRFWEELLYLAFMGAGWVIPVSCMSQNLAWSFLALSTAWLSFITGMLWGFALIDSKKSKPAKEKRTMCLVFLTCCLIFGGLIVTQPIELLFNFAVASIFL